MNTPPYIVMRTISEFLSLKYLICIAHINNYWKNFIKTGIKNLRKFTDKDINDICEFEKLSNLPLYDIIEKIEKVINWNGFTDFKDKVEIFFMDTIDVNKCKLCSRELSDIKCNTCNELNIYKKLKNESDLFKIYLHHPVDYDINNKCKKTNKIHTNKVMRVTYFTIIFPEKKHYTVNKMDYLISHFYNEILVQLSLYLFKDLSVTNDNHKIKSIYNRLYTLIEHNKKVEAIDWIENDNSYSTITYFEYVSTDIRKKTKFIIDISGKKIGNMEKKILENLTMKFYHGLEIVAIIFVKYNGKKGGYNMFDFIYNEKISYGIYSPLHYLCEYLNMFLYIHDRHIILSTQMYNTHATYVNTRMLYIQYDKSRCYRFHTKIFNEINRYLRRIGIMSDKKFITIRFMFKKCEKNEYLYFQNTFNDRGYIINDNHVGNENDILKKYITKQKKIMRFTFNICANYNNVVLDIFKVKVLNGFKKMLK